MSNRRIVCEAAFGFGPFDTLISSDWTELVEAGRPRIKEAAWTFGRDDELEHFQPGTATVLLSNRDRHLDPDNPASPHAGDLLPYTPIRLRSKNEDTGTFEDEFYGFVQGGWEQVLAPKRTGDCRLELVDLLGVIAGYTLPDVFVDALRQISTLVGIWELNEPETDESVPDLSGNSHDGNVVGSVTFGERGTQPGEPGSALFECQSTAFPDRDQSFIDLGRSQLLASSFSTSTVVATIKRRTAATTNFGVVFAHGNGNEANSGVTLKVKPDGKLEYIYLTNGGGVNFQHPTPIGNTGHCVIGTGAGIAIDTATLDTTSVAGSSARVNGAYIGGGRGVLAADHWDGWIGLVAIYDGNLGTTDREAVIEGCDRLAGMRSDEHIAWALDHLGVPSGKRNLSAGTVIMGGADTKDRDALEWMRQVTATEGGSLYVDHRDGGKIRFTDRYHRFLNSRSTVSQATFSDDPAGGSTSIRYPAEGLVVASNGLDGVVNQASVTWVGGSITVTDDTSFAAYGPRQRTIETVATTANQARSAAEWVVARYKDPRSRIRGATATKRVTYDRHDEVQDLKIDDRVTFRVQPLHTGTATTVSLFVDGVSHAARGVEWETSFRFAQVDTFTPWVWGTSAWDTTAVWG